MNGFLCLQSFDNTIFYFVNRILENSEIALKSIGISILAFLLNNLYSLPFTLNSPIHIEKK